MTLEELKDLSFRKLAGLGDEALMQAQDDVFRERKRAKVRMQELDGIPCDEFRQMDGIRHACTHLLERIRGARWVCRERRIRDSEANTRTWQRAFIQAANSELHPNDYLRVSERADEIVLQHAGKELEPTDA